MATKFKKKNKIQNLLEFRKKIEKRLKEINKVFQEEKENEESVLKEQLLSIEFELKKLGYKEK